MISGWGRAAGAVIPALGSGRYSPGPNIVLSSWLKGSDPNCTINVFWGQPGALATVSKKVVFYLSDEIFAIRAPILVTIDAQSTAILTIELASDRSAKTWETHVQDLGAHR